MPAPAYIRSMRIQELTKMALAGRKLEAIQHRANQMAAPKTAKEYVDEVLRRVNKK